MSQQNYEAIGRCKVLKERIERLETLRGQAISDMRAYMQSLGGNIKGTIYQFDPGKGHCLLKAVESADADLISAVDEYNRWAPNAGERPYALYEPDEQ